MQYKKRSKKLMDSKKNINGLLITDIFGVFNALRKIVFV